MGIYDKRLNYKPFEYPGVMKFINSINQTFWVHNEVDFTSDIQDFHTNLSLTEKEVVKRSLLSIAQVEIGVKTFWGDLYKFLPKPEFNGLGSTFAECEFRHSEAYSRLLEVLGYTGEFEKLLEVPVFAERIALIEKNLRDKSFFERTLFFVFVIENSSLFSQFAHILSFTRFKGYMKNVSNIIGWTSIDEQTHADAGVYILNLLQEEGYVVDQAQMQKTLLEYIELESRLLDWIYEEGELDFFSKEDILNFIKYRVDQVLSKMGLDTIFNISNDQYKPMAWFEEEVFADAQDDFFAKRPTDYTKHDKSITKDDLF